MYYFRMNCNVWGLIILLEIFKLMIVRDENQLLLSEAIIEEKEKKGTNNCN